MNRNLTARPRRVLAAFTPAATLLLLCLRTESAPPVISSVAPSVGRPGEQMQIFGSHFSSVPEENIVWFGATRASVASATPGNLEVAVPLGAIYQSVSVSVGGLTAYSS